MLQAIVRFIQGREQHEINDITTTVDMLRGADYA